MFHHRRELVARVSDVEAAWKGDKIMAFKLGLSKRKALQVHKQSASYGLDADGLLNYTTASLAYIIIVADEKRWCFKISKQSLQCTRVDVDGHIATWFCRRG
jgi:hypothetical protein